MLEIGYKLCSEEHPATDMVRFAVRAEEAGFGFAMISDHFHPWVDAQGESPFVWGVIGAVANATDHLRVATGVTCPTMRMHPALVAHAAATSASLLRGRFLLGLGSGENLNEHVLGGRWPPADERLDMLEEAIDVIRLLWEGGWSSYQGAHYTLEGARLYSMPKDPPPILVAAGGPRAAELAGRVGDGLIGTAPDRDVFDAFDAAGGTGKPRFGEVTVCWAEDEAEARRTAFRRWPNAAIEGELVAELPLPRHFEQAASMLDEDAVAEKVVCGPDPELHLDAIRTYADAGFDHVWIHQVGPDQEGFFRFYQREVLPKVG
jgi:coenzyme F420-dependent glucose-6-phosphate dehydrogenase